MAATIEILRGEAAADADIEELRDLGLEDVFFGGSGHVGTGSDATSRNGTPSICRRCAGGHILRKPSFIRSLQRSSPAIGVSRCRGWHGHWHGGATGPGEIGAD